MPKPIRLRKACFLPTAAPATSGPKAEGHPSSGPFSPNEYRGPGRIASGISSRTTSIVGCWVSFLELVPFLGEEANHLPPSVLGGPIPKKVP